MIVKLAEPKQDAEIGELLVNAFVTAYAEKMPEVVVTDERKEELRNVARKREEATVFVVEHDGKVVGTVSLFKPGSPHSEAWIKNAADLRHLAIDVAYRGKELGRSLSKALLDEAERVAWSWGIDAICLHVRRGAHGVARLYQSRGFQREPIGDMNLPTVYLEAYLKRRD